MLVQKSTCVRNGPGLAQGGAMSRRLTALWVCSALLVVVCARGAHAQAAAPSAQEDLTMPVPSEPTFVLVNLPTTLRLPKHKGSFNLTHRFQGDLTEGSFTDQLSNLFGIDNGAVIGFEFRYAPIEHLQLVAYRNTIDRTIQFTGQYDYWRQGGALPVSFSPIVAIEGGDNFSENFSPSLGATISRTLGDHGALYAVPMWVHNSAASTDETRDTFTFGMGARLRIGGGRTYLVGEVTPRLAGYEPQDPVYAFGIETRVGGHMFSLVFQNGFATTFGQVARGGFPDALYLGFNLGRKFF
jgi:uncharacterized beta barrel domain-containing protein DUF5777